MNRSWREFVGSFRFHPWEERTSEDFEMVIGGLFSVKQPKGRFMVNVGVGSLLMRYVEV